LIQDEEGKTVIQSQPLPGLFEKMEVAVAARSIQSCNALYKVQFITSYLSQPGKMLYSSDSINFNTVCPALVASISAGSNVHWKQGLPYFISLSNSYDPVRGNNVHLLAHVVVLSPRGTTIFESQAEISANMTFMTDDLEPGDYIIQAAVSSSLANDNRIAEATATLILHASTQSNIPLLHISPGRFTNIQAFVPQRDLVLHVKLKHKASCGSWTWKWNVEGLDGRDLLSTALTPTSGTMCFLGVGMPPPAGGC
jgi:hypothetical protein